MGGKFCLLGLGTVASGVVTIATALIVNPWFNVWRGALSDMGREGLPTSWVFNSGFIVTSALGIGFTYCLLKTFREVYMVMASGIYLVSVAHLALIGLFPEGTAPHWALSYEFFLMMYVTIFTYGAAFLFKGLISDGLTALSLGVAGLTASVIWEWPSVAVLELFNAGIIISWYLVMTHAVLKTYK